MKLKEQMQREGGDGLYLIWLLGIPIPVLLLFSCCEAAHRVREQVEVICLADACGPGGSGSSPGFRLS